MARKFKMTVVTTKEIEVTLNDSLFKGTTEAKYLEEFSNHMWAVNDLSEVAEYAGRMVAEYDSGNFDFLGIVAPSYSPKEDVNVSVVLLSDDTDVEDLEEIKEEQ